MNASLTIAVVLGCLALLVAVKIGLFILKIIFGAVALAVLGGAVGWLLLRH
jgi:hypothetical protein